jgi:hypothetical protein
MKRKRAENTINKALDNKRASAAREEQATTLRTASGRAEESRAFITHTHKKTRLH